MYWRNRIFKTCLSCTCIIPLSANRIYFEGATSACTKSARMQKLLYLIFLPCMPPHLLPYMGTAKASIFIYVYEVSFLVILHLYKIRSPDACIIIGNTGEMHVHVYYNIAAVDKTTVYRYQGFRLKEHGSIQNYLLVR